ncbi:MAG: hypothetical protein E5X35_07420 [Mesorhizobium sp.]|uniref:hypothetical protein n=1 Tax=Mesorhizobium TaxID=68287 RepID=UPI001205E165|nr:MULTISPECIES: hypothetical protein [Mesorhizobium]MCF6120862.1 hypothetical protein [Mesorhizobium muleiense]TIR34537.1 MAG: hypothetical protein E5X35_07420 [Mesorhizobium sp.]
MPAVTRQANARNEINGGSGERTEPQPCQGREMGLQAIIKELQNRMAQTETERLLKALQAGLPARLATNFDWR